MADEISQQRIEQFVTLAHEVKRWIEQVLNVRLGTSVVAANVLPDLHTPLKDGIVLCHLMLRISERSIPRIQQDTSFAFQLKENVSFFIEAIAEYGVPEHRLFTVADLFDNQNMVNVVHSIAALGQLASERGFLPTFVHSSTVFLGATSSTATTTTSSSSSSTSTSSSLTPPVAHHSPGTRKRTGSFGVQPKMTPAQIELIKRQLKTARTLPKIRRKVKQSAVVARTQLLLSLSEQERAHMIEIEARIARVQALVRGFLTRKFVRKLKYQQAQRTLVAKEILEADERYVQSLDLVRQLYIIPLKQRKLVSEKELRVVFSNLETIFHFTTKVVEMIEPRVHSWGVHSCLADVFLELAAFMKVYTLYLQNCEHAQDRVVSLKQTNREFAKFLEEAEARPESKGLPLQAYLIQPVQHVPRYGLLIRELLRYTWPTHPDYEQLTMANEALAEVGEHLNEMTRLAQSQRKLIEISRTLYGAQLELQEPSRRFLREGVFGTTVLLLFNDMLLIGEKGGKFKSTLRRLSGLSSDSEKTTKVLDMVFLNLVAATPASGGFEVVHEGSGKRLIKIKTSSSVDAVGWVADISSAKEALISCRQARAQAVEQSKTDDSKTAAKILQDRSPPMNDRRRGFHRQESVSGLISARDTVTQQIEAIEQEIAELDNNPVLGSVAREKRRLALKARKERLAIDLEAVEHRIADGKRASPSTFGASPPPNAKRLSF